MSRDGLRPGDGPVLRRPGGPGDPLPCVGPQPRADPVMERSSAWTRRTQHAGAAGLHGRSPLLRLQSDERLVALIRRGQPGRLRGARRPLPVAPARVLPAHARLQGGRRGRAAGGLRRRLQRDARRRARDQRAAVAVPDRAQPLAQPPAPRAARSAWTRWTSTCPSAASTTADKVHKREEFRHAHRRRPGPAGDAAHRAAAARDRRALLRADRRGDGDDGPVGQVAARARPRVAGRGRRGAPADLRGGPRRARRGRRGPARARAAPVRRHLRTCDRCRAFRKQLRETNKALAAVFPVGPLLLLKKLAARPPRHDRRAARRRRRRPRAAARPPARRRRAAARCRRA